MMILDREEQKEVGTESDDNEEQESAGGKEESTKNKGERMEETEGQIIGLDIYSSDDIACYNYQLDRSREHPV